MLVTRQFFSALLVCLLTLSISTDAQTTQSTSTAGTTVAVQRDPQAVAILQQSINAFGGAPVSGVQDFIATGTITFNWAGESVQGSVLVRGKGLHEYRMDATTPLGTQSLVVNGFAGLFTPVAGQSVSLSSNNGLVIGGFTFPALRMLNALNDSSTGVTYSGLLARNGSQVHAIHIAPPVDSSLNPDGSFSSLGSFDLYIDSSTYQLLGVAETIWLNGDTTRPYRHELAFSNYSPTNGLLVPFTITETFGGQQTWSMTLSSITFNSGLSDSLFSF